MSYFTYAQNNSGGVFDSGPNIAGYVIVEASDFMLANQIAEEVVGIYFDGCETGHDCDCCGDRWDRQTSWNEGTERPEIYGQSVYEMARKYRRYEAVIFHADGTRERVKFKEEAV